MKRIMCIYVDGFCEWVQLVACPNKNPDPSGYGYVLFNFHIGLIGIKGRLLDRRHLLH